jgi:hypothetical protein
LRALDHLPKETRRQRVRTGGGSLVPAPRSRHPPGRSIGAPVARRFALFARISLRIPPFGCAFHPFGGHTRCAAAIESRPTSPLECPGVCGSQTSELSTVSTQGCGGLFLDQANSLKRRPRVSPSSQASLSLRTCAPTATASSRSYGGWSHDAPNCWPRARPGCRGRTTRPQTETSNRRLLDRTADALSSAIQA